MSDKELHIKRRKIAKEDGKTNDEPGVATSLDISDREYVISADEGEGSHSNGVHSDDAATHSDDNAEEEGGHVKHYLIKHMEDKSKLLSEVATLEENKLYVKNITDEITKEDLIHFFCNATGFVDTRVVGNSSGKSKKFAYVEFDTKENAANFFNTLKDSNVDKYKTFSVKGVDLYVAICNSTKVIYEEGKVFIKFSECQADVDEVVIKKGVSDFLARHGVTVEEIRLLGGSPPTHGYLQLSNNEDVVKCVETIKEGTLENVHFTLKYSIPIIKKKIIPDVEKIKANKEKNKKLQEEKKKEENNCTIVVKNLHFNTRKNKLKKLFEQIGEIEKIHLSKKVSENNIKRNRGYAFITFKNSNDATSALILNDSVVDGRSILVSKFLGNDSRAKHRDGEGNNHQAGQHDTEEQPPRGGKYHTNRRGNYHHINNVKSYNHQERRRINLNKPVEPNAAVEKRTDQAEGEPTPLTNDDFRKFFFK
ncbi:Rna-binding protein [Plasmodium coatneyi]|uniref:Rna-binding protein n=1 Tax=Plasmodium coatneyi TaxID=208452 RepID=A0A1B1DXN3_9APIC|nr:Rna-binding protein [Plasmodium coatneyi]ANQ07367.1 Rna-binding protein [Plasmodium coatneyi]